METVLAERYAFGLIGRLGFLEWDYFAHFLLDASVEDQHDVG